MLGVSLLCLLLLWRLRHIDYTVDVLLCWPAREEQSALAASSTHSSLVTGLFLSGRRGISRRTSRDVRAAMETAGSEARKEARG